MSNAPTLGKIRRIGGIAGQYSYRVPVTYPGEKPETVEFVGSVYGGRVVMVSPNGRQTFVSADVMDRCGSKLTESWVRKFFGE